MIAKFSKALTTALAIVSVIVAIGAATAGYFASRATVELAQPANRTGTWAGYQLQLAHLRLVDALRLHTTLADDDSFYDVIERFDILWSRVEVLITDETKGLMKATSSAVTTESQYRTFLDEWAPVLDGTSPSNVAFATAMLSDLAALRPAAETLLRDLQTSNNINNSKLAKHSRELGDLQVWLMIITVLTMATLCGLLVAKAKQANFLADRDPLTNLLNRRQLVPSLQLALRLAKHRRYQVAVHCLDLARFKLVNDALGQIAGDEFLRVIAGKLESLAKKDDFVFRVGGDEFTFVQSNIRIDTDIDSFIDSVSKAIGDKIQLFGHEVQIPVTIGTAVFPNDGQSPQAIIKMANLALHDAKQTSVGISKRYVRAMEKKIERQRWLEQELRKAIDHDGLDLHFQPKFDLFDLELSGAEALLRWNHPDEGWISPGEFIPIAEEVGLIAPIGSWVLWRAARDAKRWYEQTNTPIRFAVNLSIAQFSTGNIVKEIDYLMVDNNIEPRFLEMEITESLLITHTEMVSEVIHRLREQGLTVALDDFGTGYSSLSYLQHFPFDKVKIDRSFIAELSAESSRSPIIEGIIHIARGLDMEVVAEGIETMDQLRILQEMQCHEAQGFLLGKPQPMQSLIAQPTCLPLSHAKASVH